MKKTLSIAFTINVITYFTVYMITTFIVWDFRNPFQWIMDMPTYNTESRAMLLFFVVFYYLVILKLSYDITNPSKKDTPST